MNDYLMRELFDNFPRIHTAIAELIACVLFIMPRTKRLKGWHLYACFAAFAGIFGITNYYNERAAGIMWIILMASCMLEMFLMMWLCCKGTVWDCLYYWAHAFIAAEFAASLEWQINCYIIYEIRWISPLEFYYVMSAVYVVVFGLLLLINKKSKLLDNSLTITSRDGFLAGCIVMLMFLMGNFRYLFPNSYVSEVTGAGILFIRTLADLSGLVLLYAVDLQRKEHHSRYEFDAMDNLMRQQYQQFRLAEANNEAVHRVYHDLKHQIAYLREEVDEEKKAHYLKEIDRLVSTHEAEANTGNNVLDTLLTGKNLMCMEAGITMTIFADAADIGFMDVMDVCSVFGNAIDNAIEYEKQISDPDCRLIKVTVRSQNNFLLVRIDNYCESEIKVQDGLIPTSKKDKNAHGFGLKSIRHTIEKYSGSLSIEQQGEWFSLIALIPIMQTK